MGMWLYIWFPHSSSLIVILLFSLNNQKNIISSFVPKVFSFEARSEIWNRSDMMAVNLFNSVWEIQPSFTGHKLNMYEIFDLVSFKVIVFTTFFFFLFF